MANSEKKVLTIDLPFDSSKHEIVIGQGFNSPFSHRIDDSIDLKYSVDFVLPVGTPITAVQDGVVKHIRRNRDYYDGLDPIKGRRAWSTNIDVVHPQFHDGRSDFFSMLQHLDPDSIQVCEGQNVYKGQVLANTGLTGWVGPIPHLHLSMCRNIPLKSATVPFSFRNYDGPLEDDEIAYHLFLCYQFGPEILRQIFETREQAAIVMMNT